jgi:hypothetical protein
MRGDIDHPPIIISTDRGKALLHMAVLALFAAILSPVARTRWQANPAAWLVLIIFGFLFVTTLWELLLPGRLIITRDGFEQHALLGARRWRWSEARRFKAASNRFFRFVGFDSIKSASARRRFDEGINRDWELSPQALAELLNEARGRWFKPGNP